jgi:hypothetical protein
MANTISIKVEGGATISNVPFTTGMNVQQALEAAYNSFSNPPNIPTISFWLEYYGTSLGYLVTNMDGVTQQGSKYWMLYVNGILATEGIDSTILSDNDVVSFKYESYSEEIHGHTIMKQFHLAKTRNG